MTALSRLAALPDGVPLARTRDEPAHALHYHVMGARFRFASDSPALLDLVEAAYGGLAGHLLPGDAAELVVELDLLPSRPTRSEAPPPLRTRLQGDCLHGAMDALNQVVVRPGERHARIMVTADMLEHPYLLRYEFIEFAVFLLAARCQRLVPLHGACVGRDGRGVLLLGDSGAGKSTLALNALLHGLELLSEDAVFVQPDAMLATGVANFLHVRTDGPLDGIGEPAARRWIAGSPVIRRRSGVEKFEADLRHAPLGLRCAPAPMRLVGAVLLDRETAGPGRPLLSPATGAEVASCLAAGQPHARTQDGWTQFERWAAGGAAYRLLRGKYAAEGVGALRELLG